jgi:glycosyltransferase involved in cell wall biosynthesis
MMEGMRILVVADYYRHGSARVIEDRAAALARRGHRVTLLAAADPCRVVQEAEAARAAGLDPCLVPWTPAARGPVALARLLRSFRAAFRALAGWRPARGLERWRLTAGSSDRSARSVGAPRFDAILFNQPLSARAVLGSGALDGAGMLYTFHSPWPVEWAIVRGHEVRDGEVRGGLRARVEFAARRAIERSALRDVRAVTLLSDYMRSQLSLIHPNVPAQDATLIPGGVDLHRFRPRPAEERSALRAQLGFPPGGRLLLTVRRLVPRMGLDVLLHAFRHLAGDFPDLQLAVGGSGPLEPELRALAGELGLADRVRFLGFVPEDELPALYAAADLFVLPTASLEGFGLVTIESLAAGTPVLGTPVGATPAILRPIDPRLLAPDPSAAGIAAAARRVLLLSDGALRALGDRGRRRAETCYDAERVGDSLETLLASLAGRPLRRAASRVHRPALARV